MIENDKPVLGHSIQNPYRTSTSVYTYPLYVLCSSIVIRREVAPMVVFLF